MHAMVYRGPYRVRVEEKDVPAIEHPNDAIVKVQLAAICGSDLHLYHGLMPDTRVGHTFGHEFIGVVHEVGPSVQNLQVGDRVMVPFNVFCGSCYFCARGLYSNCHNVNPNATAVGGIYGYSHTTGGYDGGQAEYVRVPFADVGPSKIPDWLSDEDAVLLTDACPTGYFGAQLGDITEGDVVVVFGAGPVGLFAARSAWLMGAGRVIVIDHLEYRLEKARTFAYAETINFTEVDDIVAGAEEADRLARADVVHRRGGRRGRRQPHAARHRGQAEASGRLADRAELGHRLCAKGGTISVMGAYGPMFSAVKFGDAMNKGLTLRMNQCPVKRQWPRLFEHIQNGYCKPSDIVTHRFQQDDESSRRQAPPPWPSPITLAVIAVTVGAVHADVDAGHPDGLARSVQPGDVPELAQCHQRRDLAHSVLGHQRLAAGLAARERAQITLDRRKLDLEQVDHLQCDADPLVRVER